MKIRNYQTVNNLLIFASFVLIGLEWTNLPLQVPLFFGRPWGEDQLAAKAFILLLPAISLVVTLINNFLARIYFKKEKDFFAETAIMSSLIVTLLTSISLIKIIMLVV